MSDSRTPRRPSTVAAAIVLVLLVLGGVIGLAASLVRGTTWTSESQLSWDPSVRASIDPNYSAPDSTTFDRQVADQKDVVLSDAVVDQVASSLDLSAAAVRAAVDVKTTSGSSVFLIDATASSAAEARRIATQVTNAYVDALQTANADALQSRLDSLTTVITELRRQLASAGASTAGPLATNIADLVSQQAAVQVAAEAVPVEATVQRAAETPTSPSSLGPFVSLVLGAVLGAIVGVCLVLVLASRAAQRRPAGHAAPDRAAVAPAASQPLATARAGALQPALHRPAPTAPAAEPVPAQQPVAPNASSASVAKDEPVEQDGSDVPAEQGSDEPGAAPAAGRATDRPAAAPSTT